MDLRSIINNEAGERPAQKQAAPVTPIQSHPQQVFREYSHSLHASPGKHPSQDYGSQSQGPYASPKTYPGTYPARPPPPPPAIQASPQIELRSPVRTYSAQSPYQHTPTSSLSGGQYPFPPTHQTPQSPAQHQQYPPSFQQRDSYSSAVPPPHHQRQNSNNQSSPAPQTPPIGLPGGAAHSYMQHQRSLSSVSTSTPTSAQSQHLHFNQYPQDSPVSAGQYLHSQVPPPVRQQSVPSQHSQPGTPLGPPLNQRQLSGGFTQPTSPYQQRAVPQGAYPHYQHASPISLPHALPSTPGAYDSQRATVSEQQSRSHSSRERSASVSPKTRLPSQPRGEMPHSQMDHYNTTKRKMDDRELSVEAPRSISQTELVAEINGDHRRTPSLTASPQQPPKKRTRYTEPPIWAQSVRGKNSAGVARVPSKVNGKQYAAASNVASAPIKVETNGHRHQSPAEVRGGPQSGTLELRPPLLGQWETSISGKKPTQDIVKEMADFIYRHVVSRGDLGELSTGGVEVEIEAKLGQFIDRGVRLEYPISTECIINPPNEVRFRSAMTENQHKVLNDFLNVNVREAHPQNPQRSKGRVPIDYLHRREVDKFYELPRSIFNTLPPAVRQQHNPNHTMKIRVTHDQKTNQVLAKIIKVRIADLNIFLPKSPLDCRISINFEMKYDGDMDEIMAQNTLDRSSDRSKDRLSYTHGHYQVDLTQVSKVRKHNGIDVVEKEHELEIELATAVVKDQGQRAAAGQPHQYDELIEGFMDNIRVLTRAIPPQ